MDYLNRLQYWILAVALVAAVFLILATIILR